MLRKLFIGTVNPSEENPITVDNTLRRHWNDYTRWLESKKLRGNPELDKGGKWEQVLEQYRKENPMTLINKKTIPIIQKEFQNYRNYVIDKVKRGKASFGTGTNENNFLKDLSIVDSIAGSKTTAHNFPDEYLQTFEKGNLINTQKLGFASK